MRKGRWIIKGLIAAAALAMMLERPVSVYGAGRMGSVRIQYHGKTEEDQEVFLTGAEFALYPAGNMKDGVWSLNEAFEGAGVSLEGESASDRMLQAKKLYEYAVRAGLTGRLQCTGDKGVTVFGRLPEGLYLIAQTEKLELDGQGSFMSGPFLLSIPETVGQDVLYDVTAEPKGEWGENQEPEPSEPDGSKEPAENPDSSSSDRIKTGDAAPLGILLGLALLSLAAAVYSRS